MPLDGCHFHNWSDYNGVANNTRALPQPSLRYREASAEEGDTHLQESDHEGSLPRRDSDTFILWKIIELQAMSKLRHV